MRIPEKTILGIGAAMLTISSLKSLLHVLDGHAAARMHQMAGQMATPESFRIGYIIGLTITLALEILTSVGLWTLLVRRMRKPQGDA